MTKTYKKIMPIRIVGKDSIVFADNKSGEEYTLRLGKNLGGMKRVLLSEAGRDDVLWVDAKTKDGEVTAIAYFFADGSIGEFTERG